MQKKLFYVFSIDYQLISHRKNLVMAAINAGYKVTVVAHATKYKNVIENMGARFIEFPINRVGTNIFEEIKTLWFLIRLYNKYKPDIVHHVSMKVVLWGSIAAKLTRIKKVVNAINGLGIYFESRKVDSIVKRIFMQLMKFGHNRNNVTTIFQNREDELFFSDYGVISPKQVWFIKGSGVDLNEFCHSEVPLKRPAKIVFTSRMIEEKGVIDIIEAAKILKKDYQNDITFQLCGLIETNPKAISLQYLQEQCDGTYIQYLGYQENIKQILTESTIVILPSYYCEGVPKSLIEAAAIGRPIITTDWIGCKEVVDDGINGFLVHIRSPKDIANKIEILLNDNTLLKNMGNASRYKAEKEFSVEYVVKEHIKIYEKTND